MTENKSIKDRVLLILSTFLPHFAVSMAMGAVGPLAPFLQSTLDISRAQLGALTSVHSVGWIVMALAAGSIVERTGIRSWIFWCPAITCLLTLLFTGISSYVQWVAIFLLLGFAFSFINPATVKAIILGFPTVGRGTALAIKQTGTPAGVFLAAVTLPAIAVSFGWKWSMAFVALINLAAGILGWALYRDSRPGRPVKPDGEKTPGSYKKDIGELLHNRDFLLVSLLQGFFNIGQFVIQSYLVLYMVESLGYPTIYAGLVMALTQFSGVAGRIAWGLMSDFVFAGKRVPTLKVAGLTTAAGLLGLALIDASTPAWIIWIAASIAGAGSIGFAGTAILLRAELTGKNLAATSTGMGMAIGAWGVLMGPPVFGLIVDTTGSYKMAWALISALSLGATFLLGLVRERKPQGRADEA